MWEREIGSLSFRFGKARMRYDDETETEAVGVCATVCAFASPIYLSGSAASAETYTSNHRTSLKI